jgi:hypothetical protein
MMLIVDLILLLMLQTPAPGHQVVVGLRNGQQLLVQDPEFSGFIEGRNDDALLIYREGHVRGEMPLKNVSRIDIGPYEKHEPYLLMTVTLRNGQTLRVESDRHAFISVRGKTELGAVTIKHPDPISAPVKLRTKPANRKKDLTIQYLEIPAS